MTEVRKSGTIYKCRRCLKRPNETYRPDPNEVLMVCAECGTENWCLPVKGKVKAKKVIEAAEREVAESTPDEVPLDPSTDDSELEQESESPPIQTEDGEIETETVKEIVNEKLDKEIEEIIEEEAINVTMTERESLLAKLAALDSEETE